MPTPSTNRSGYASHRARVPFAMAKASRAQTLAMPVATTIRSVADNRIPARLKASLLPTLSGNQSAPKPSSSTVRATVRSPAAGCSSSAKLQTPTRPIAAATARPLSCPDWLIESAAYRRSEQAELAADALERFQGLLQVVPRVLGRDDRAHARLPL